MRSYLFHEKIEAGKEYARNDFFRNLGMLHQRVEIYQKKKYLLQDGQDILVVLGNGIFGDKKETYTLVIGPIASRNGEDYQIEDIDSEMKKTLEILLKAEGHKDIRFW